MVGWLCNIHLLSWHPYAFKLSIVQLDFSGWECQLETCKHFSHPAISLWTTFGFVLNVQPWVLLLWWSEDANLVSIKEWDLCIIIWSWILLKYFKLNMNKQPKHWHFGKHIFNKTILHFRWLSFSCLTDLYPFVIYVQQYKRIQC